VCVQLLDNKKADDYQLPMPIAVKLRPYQQEGINWLAFLRRFGLHGVLADDMVRTDQTLLSVLLSVRPGLQHFLTLL